MNRLFNLAVDPTDLGMSLLRAGTTEELHSVIAIPQAQTHERIWTKPKLSDFDVQRRDGWEFEEYDKGILMHGVPATSNTNSLRKLGKTLPAGVSKVRWNARLLRYTGAASWYNQGIYIKYANKRLNLLSFGKDAYDFQLYLQTYRDDDMFDVVTPHEFVRYGANEIWMRGEYERATNYLRFYFSPDGYFWQPLTTMATAEVTDAVEVGMYCNPNLGGTNAATFRLAAATSFQHFEMEYE
ncbi:hypothetical protein [Stenotrophomonas phage BUCT598]|uniref:Uncharacterized protein n=1 Tax=Stenotrophomonas phage BUCT598 TaxID=2834253 RepID=A0A8F2JC76_9CAUD|nr:hypothetical protein [Stenotrophomonas phage BUCT598]